MLMRQVRFILLVRVYIHTVSVAQSFPTLCYPVDRPCWGPPSMRFPRQEYQSGLLFSSPMHLHDPGIKPTSPLFPALAGGFFPPRKPSQSINCEKLYIENNLAICTKSYWAHCPHPTPLGFILKNPFRKLSKYFCNYV